MCKLHADVMYLCTFQTELKEKYDMMKLNFYAEFVFSTICFGLGEEQCLSHCAYFNFQASFKRNMRNLKLIHFFANAVI